VIKLLFRHKLTNYDKQLAVAKGELKSRIGKYKEIESPLKKNSSLSKGLNLLEGLNQLDNLKMISDMFIKSQNVTVKLAYGKGGLIAFLERIFRGTSVADR